MKGRGRRIVVDADIGCGAADPRRADRGETVDHRALAFSRCLEALYDARHVAVFSPSLLKEWQNHTHPGSSGKRWLARMVERRLFDKINQEPDSGWLEEIIRAELQDGDREVALKDRHLVTTASTEADDRLLSGDGKAREKYARLARTTERLETLHWVDPTWENVPSWLLERAPDHQPWTLGAEANL